MPRRGLFRRSFLRKSRSNPNLAGMPHRRQPHIYPKGAPLFLTWRLHGSIPPSPSPSPLTAGDFVCLDRQLDHHRRGPMHLSRPDIAVVVIECLQKGVELGHYDLDAWVIMPNHVHILLHPKISPSVLVNSLKGASARYASRVLGRTGDPFWQKESSAHRVRNSREFVRIRAYIEQNPVEAGLVEIPEAFSWSSASARKTAARVRPYARLFCVPKAAPTRAMFPTSAPARESQIHC